MSPRYRRRWHRHGHVRNILLTIFALLFVSSAWAVIFTAMTAAHSGETVYGYVGAAPSPAGASSGSAYSVEVFPVGFVDSHGRTTTLWETDVHNCYGSSTRSPPQDQRNLLDSLTTLKFSKCPYFFHRVAV